MADVEKGSASTQTPPVAAKSPAMYVTENDLPKGWKYKTVTIARKRFWYASPPIQLLIVAMVCFMCPGMFNALSGIGNAGLADPHVADNAGTALYACFCA